MAQAEPPDSGDPVPIYSPLPPSNTSLPSNDSSITSLPSNAPSLTNGVSSILTLNPEYRESSLAPKNPTPPASEKKITRAKASSSALREIPPYIPRKSSSSGISDPEIPTPPSSVPFQLDVGNGPSLDTPTTDIAGTSTSESPAIIPITQLPIPSPSPMASNQPLPENGSPIIPPAPLVIPGASPSEATTPIPGPQVSNPSPKEDPPIPPSLPWASRLKSSLRNLHRTAPPKYNKDGIPIVRAPASVLLRGSAQWENYIVARFLGKPPPPSKIYADLNPIWGRLGNISMIRYSSNSYLILVPNKSTREWVIQIGYWQSDTCGFVVSMWSPSGSLQKQEPLISLPIWVKLANIPPGLHTAEGISLLAGGIGEPMHTEKSRMNFERMGEAKVKVEIMLNSPTPQSIIVEDDDGDTTIVSVEYPRLPPKCSRCGEFGHLVKRCFTSTSSAQEVARFDREVAEGNQEDGANKFPEETQEVGANKEDATVPVIAASPVKVPKLPLTKASPTEIVIPPIAIPAVAAALPSLIIVNNQQNEKEKENNVMSVVQVDSTNHQIEHLAPAHSSPISVTSATKTISDSATTEDGEIIASAQKILRAISQSPAIPTLHLPSSKKKTKMKKLSDIYSSPLSSIKLH